MRDKVIAITFLLPGSPGTVKVLASRYNEVAASKRGCEMSAVFGLSG